MDTLEMTYGGLPIDLERWNEEPGGTRVLQQGGENADNAFCTSTRKTSLETAAIVIANSLDAPPSEAGCAV
jgi:hypothetical protein